MTTAKLLMTQAEADRDKPGWLAARIPLVTGSEIAKIVLGKWGGQFTLYHAKVNGIEQIDKGILKRGRRLEPDVVDELAEHTPWLGLLPGGLYANAARPWQAATLDRIGYDLTAATYEWSVAYAAAEGRDVPAWATVEDAPAGLDTWPVQLKTSATREGYGDDGTADLPVSYRAQALWEMDVWGADRVAVPVLFLPDWRLRVYWLERDRAAQRDINLMVREAEKFLRRVAERDEPEPGDQPEVTDTLRALHPDLDDAEVIIPRSLARRYVRAGRAKRKAEARLRGAQNEIRARMGRAQRAMAYDDAGELVKVCSRSISDSTVKTYVRHDDKINPGRWGRDQEG